jgi:HAD superfamily hydrolase (TIGR01544 family)
MATRSPQQGLGLLAAAAIGGVTLAQLWAHRQRAHRNVVVSLWQYLRLRWHLARADRLLVITDFDRTVTTKSCGISCHGVLEGCAELGAEYRAKATAITAHYLPIETSPDMTIEQKLPLMQDWYRQSHELLAAEPLTAAVLERAAQDSAVALRPGFVTLMLTLERLGAPLIVCSAGLGNVVGALLRAKVPPLAAACVAKLPIVSNWLQFAGPDGTGKVSGFSQPLLHMFNKNGAFLREQIGAARWKSLTEGRTVALVLGDGLGDATMADGLDLAHVLKVGFLNETDPDRIASMLPQYELKFDAVILGDGSFEWVQGLLPKPAS